MNCLWYSTGNGNEKRCRRKGCTNRLLTNHPPEKCFAQCEVAGKECKYFGHELRRKVCESCSGNVQIKTFACSIHKECTIHKQIENIACCVTCQDYLNK